MDKKTRFTYKIIESAVNKGLKYIEESGNRGVRYIVDLGAYFSKGSLQRLYFDIAQKILSDEDSKYYTLAKNLVENVDHRILKKFGINLGYNSWSYGVKIIRENAKEFGYKIPWSMIFDFKNSEYDLSTDEISTFLDSCESKGMFCCHFFMDNNEKLLNAILPILAKHMHGTYFLFLNSKILTDAMISTIANAANIAVVLLYNPAESNISNNNISERLSAQKCIYGLYSEYDDSNIDTITSDACLMDIKKLCKTFVCFIKREPISNVNTKRVSQFVRNVKNENSFPFCFIDFYDDMASVDNAISADNNFMTIDGFGQVHTSLIDNSIEINLNIKNHSIEEILNISASLNTI